MSTDLLTIERIDLSLQSIAKSVSRLVEVWEKNNEHNAKLDASIKDIIDVAVLFMRNLENESPKCEVLLNRPHLPETQSFSEPPVVSPLSMVERHGSLAKTQTFPNSVETNLGQLSEKKENVTETQESAVCDICYWYGSTYNCPNCELPMKKNDAEIEIFPFEKDTRVSSLPGVSEVPVPLEVVEIPAQMEIIVEVPVPLEVVEVPEQMKVLQQVKVSDQVLLEVSEVLQQVKVSDQVPLEVSEVPSPVEVSELPEPVQVLEALEPVQVVEVPAPVEVSELPEPVQVLEALAPVEVSELPEPVQVLEALEPVQVVEVPVPLEVVEVPVPLKVVEVPVPLKVVEVPVPLEVVEVPVPLEVVEVPVPVPVEVSKVPVEVEEPIKIIPLPQDESGKIQVTAEKKEKRLPPSLPEHIQNLMNRRQKRS